MVSGGEYFARNPFDPITGEQFCPGEPTDSPDTMPSENELVIAALQRTGTEQMWNPDAHDPAVGDPDVLA